MSIQPVFGSRTSITVTLDGLADGAIADSLEYNNTTLLTPDLRISVDAIGSNIAESGSLIVYAREGLLSGGLETDDNLTRIGSIPLNGTTAVHGVLLYEQAAPFFKLSFKQSSSNGYALGGSGNAAYTMIETVQDV